MRAFLILALLLCCVSGTDASRRRALMMQQEVAAAGSTLNDVTAYWDLDEASGNRLDSGSNGQDLTEVPTVAAVAAQISNGTDFEATTDTSTLKRADNATLSLGADVSFTFCAVVKRESVPVFPFVIVDKGASASAGSDTEYRMEIEAGSGQNYYSFIVGNGSSSARVNASTHGASSTSAFEFVLCWYDSVAETINIKVNNGTTDSTAWTGNTQDAGNAFSIGSASGNAGVRMDGIIDEVAFYKRVLTGSEQTEIFTEIMTNGDSYPW